MIILFLHPFVLIPSFSQPSSLSQEEEFQHIANEAEFSIPMDTDESQKTASPGDATSGSSNGRWHVGGSSSQVVRPILGQRRSATVLNQITEEEGKCGSRDSLLIKAHPVFLFLL